MSQSYFPTFRTSADAEGRLDGSRSYYLFMGLHGLKWNHVVLISRMRRV